MSKLIKELRLNLKYVDLGGGFGINYTNKAKPINLNKYSKLVENFSKNLSMHIAAADPKSIEIDELNPDLINKERSIYTEQLKESNKPQDIIEKIVDGKIKKFYDKVCLLEQFFVMDPKVKIKDVIQELNKNNNNDFKIISYYMYKLGQQD